MHPFAEWTIKNTKYRKVAAVAMDYAFGDQTVGGFQHVFEEQGGQIVQKVWVPLNTNDFAPFVAQIRRDADAVLVLFTGRLALQFLKQYQEAGLQGKLPILSGGTTTDESVLPSMGDEALGVISALHDPQSARPCRPTRSSPRPLETKAGKISSYHSEATYTNMRWIVEAIKMVSGKRRGSAPRCWPPCARSTSRTPPRGPISIDAYGNPIQNIYVRKVERVGGRLQNTVIATIPSVKPVLDLQARGLSQAAALHARLSALQALPVQALC